MHATNPRARLALAALTIFFAASANAVYAGGPEAQIHETLDRVLAVTRTFHSEQDFIDNKPRLREIIVPRFDFTEMARRSLGDEYWSGLQGKEQEFVAAFVQFAERSYTNALGTYRGEKMTYDRETIDNDFAEVATGVVGSSGEATPIVYKLHLIGPDWKVYDVVIDRISLVANFKSQFGRILKTASLDELMQKLRSKGA
ncbi:MAG TPA: ABC transporter substrate-binding protein [Verrucomicrobiae bacterium]|jgi:phospholipid transport system substrate-binding protein|nr:ABC transporter substrate-binding protein [Verrucomicrobiae bacterium]